MEKIVTKKINLNKEENYTKKYDANVKIYCDMTRNSDFKKAATSFHEDKKEMTERIDQAFDEMKKRLFYELELTYKKMGILEIKEVKKSILDNLNYREVGKVLKNLPLSI